MTDFAVSRPLGPWVHRTTSHDLQQILKTASTVDLLVIRLDGTRMRTLDELFREYVIGFEFPDYFGWNYPAFAECMKELSWIPARAYLTVITDADELLSAEPFEMNTYLRLIEDIGRRWAGSFALSAKWGGGEVPFHTLLVNADSERER